MAEVKLPSATAAKDIIEIYKAKIESGVIPPDPARFVEFILRVPVTVEHLLPIPPVIEYIHANFTNPMIEALPRLPMSSDFPKFEFLKWIKEEFKV